MKTYSQWTNSMLNMSAFLQPGDQVDEELFDYALGALPPAYYRDGIMAMGEPTNHTRDGVPLYAIFSYSGPDDPQYRYLGDMTIADAIIRGKEKPLPVSRLYKDFLDYCESRGWEFPCTAEQFYNRANAFVTDPIFVGSDYEDEGFTLTPGWQITMIHDLCKQGGCEVGA